jgi:glycine/D-amino acid oxidase-like deaminating enzyme
MLTHLRCYHHRSMRFGPAPCLAEESSRTGQIIPWWSDLTEPVREALTLSNLASAKVGQSYDFIVVGAGIAGLAATEHAARSGYRVLCLEAGPRIGLGATGRNAGILCAGINMPISLAPPDSENGDLWLATARALQETARLASRPDSLLEVTQRGGLGLASSKTAVRRLEQEAKQRTEAGLSAHMLSVSDVKTMTGGRLNLEGVQAAICYPEEGSIQPLTLLAQMASQAKRHGATILGGASVITCNTQKDGWQVALSNGQKFNCNRLIRAVGPTAAPTARIYALAFEVRLPNSFPLFWDAAPYIYYDFRPGNGRITASGGRYGKVQASARQDKQYHDKMAEAAAKWLPELAGQKAQHTWAVNLEVASDLVPHLSPIDGGKSGLSIDGLGALGVMPGLVLGRKAVDILAKTCLLFILLFGFTGYGLAAASQKDIDALVHASSLS